MLPKEASMVKLFVTETARRVALEGMQMMGGYGYSSEYDMGAPRPRRPRLHHLRRHLGDPARHHRQDSGPSSYRPLCPFTARCTRSNGTAGRPVSDLAHWSIKPFGCSQSASWVTPSRERRG
jgi:hypothetical protein